MWTVLLCTHLCRTVACSFVALAELGAQWSSAVLSGNKIKPDHFSFECLSLSRILFELLWPRGIVSLTFSYVEITKSFWVSLSSSPFLPFNTEFFLPYSLIFCDYRKKRQNRSNLALRAVWEDTPFLKLCQNEKSMGQDPGLGKESMKDSMICF